MKCAIYARVSTEEQAKKYSIPAQLDLLRSFAQINNYEIFKEYVDEGISGTISDRPQLQELFKDAERGYFKIVLVYRIDRFFRNTLKLLSAVDKLEKIGVAFKSITENFDTTNPTGKFMISLLGSVAQLERDTLIERSKMGILKSIKEGHYMASTSLYGYDYNRQAKKLEINSYESEIVKLIFKLYQKSFSSELKVAAKLNQLNYHTRKGAQWTITQIHRILNHPGYYGKWSYGNDSERITIDIPPLIDKILFDNTQKLLRERKLCPSIRYEHNYLLSKLLYCGICGRKMGIKRGKRIVKANNKEYGPYDYQYYYCFGYRLKKKCSMKCIKKDEIDSLVWEEIKKYIKNPALIKQAIEENCRQDKDKSVSLKRDLTKIASKIERLELEDEKILRLYRKDIISEEKLRSQIQNIKTEKQILNQQRQEIEIQIESQKYLEIRLNALEKLINKIQNNIDNLTFKGKRKIIELLINKVFVQENGRIFLEVILPSFSSNLFAGQGECNVRNVY